MTLRLPAALRSRRARTIVGIASLLGIPALLPLVGLTPDYGRAQLARAGDLVDLACGDAGGGGLRCAQAAEIRSGTRRDDWWVLGYFSLGGVAALALASIRSAEDRPTPGRRGAAAVALLALGGVFDLLENAQLRASVTALQRAGVLADRDAAIAAVGRHPDATVLLGRFKMGFMAAALAVVIWSLVREPRQEPS